MHSPPNSECIRYLEKQAQKLLPELPVVQSTWMGFRPSTPDSMPIMRQTKTYRYIYYAFGHGHLGLTLGGITGKDMATIIGN